MTFPFVGTHTEADWESWRTHNAEVTGEGVTIAPAPLPAYVSPRPLVEEFPSDLTAVDADVDDCGELYVLADDGEVHRFDRRTASFRRLPCAWTGRIDRPRGLAVTRDTVYVADAGPGNGEGRIQAVSKHVLQPRWIATDPVDPVALVGAGEDVYLLDAGPADGDGSLALVDRDGRTSEVLADLADPVDAAVDREGNRYVLDCVDDSAFAVVWLAGDDEPTPGDPAGLDDPRPEPPPEEASVLIPPEWFRAAGSAVEPTCIAADRVAEVVAGVDDSADRPLLRYRHRRQAFERLARFDGGTRSVHLRRDAATCEPSALYAVASDGDGVTVLDPADANDLNGETDRYDAQLVTRLDAGVEGVQWHRVTTDLSLPAAATQVRLRYFATDDPGVSVGASPDEGVAVEAVDGIGEIIGGRLRDAGVETLAELVELDPSTVAAYASTPTYGVSEERAAAWLVEARRLADAEADELDWRPLGKPNPRDALLDDAVGRYLFVRLELVGTEFDSPSVDAFRAYFPRQSYLRYLPAIYQEDAASAAFLERFLSIFESVFTDLEEEIGAAIRYLDPDGVPAEYVPWLERWLALEADETWSTAARREHLRAAPELFKYRGTRRGLLETVRIFLGDRLDVPPTWERALEREAERIEAKLAAGALTESAAEAALDRLSASIFVWEARDLACIDDEEVREVWERLLPCPRCFAVVVPPFVADEPTETVDRIVRTQQPAHGAGRAIRLQPWIRLAGTEYDRSDATYLGVNSVLAERDLVLEGSELGADSVLAERESDGQLGLRARLGTDTNLS